MLFLAHQQGMGAGVAVVPPKIDGASTAVITTQYESIMLTSDNAGNAWWIISILIVLSLFI